MAPSLGSPVDMATPGESGGPARVTCIKMDLLGGPEEVLPVPAHHQEAVGCVRVQVQQRKAPVEEVLGS